VLTSLNQLPGVGDSYTNESGTLIRLTILPGTDPGRAAAAASRVLRAHTGDRIAVLLKGRAAAGALRAEDWRGERQLAAGLAAATPTDATHMPEGSGRGGHGLLLVILASAAVVYWLLWRRRREYQTG
jgi:hypothetical protein